MFYFIRNKLLDKCTILVITICKIQGCVCEFVKNGCIT